MRARQERQNERARDLEFEDFFMSRRRLYYRVAVTIIGNGSLAEEVTQDTFSAIYSRWDRLAAVNLDAYCRRMLVNACLTAIRKRRREQPTDSTRVDAAVDASVHDATPAHAGRVDLVAAIRDLSPRYRAVVALRYLEDLPVADVATILGISEGTVKSHTARALARLRQQLESVDEPVSLCARTA